MQSVVGFLNGENKTENLRIRLAELKRDVLIESKKATNEIVIDNGAKTTARMQQLAEQFVLQTKKMTEVGDKIKELHQYCEKINSVVADKANFEDFEKV